MSGIVIYLIIQGALAALLIYIVFNRDELRAKHAGKKDSRWEKVVMVIVAPAMGFGYSLLDGYPPKKDQLIFAGVGTAIVYGAMILRWSRQARIGTLPPPPPAERRYYYRSTDGSTVCGPDTEAKLAVMVRMGFITLDTPIADETSPEAWTPLKDRHDLTRLQQATAA